METLPEDNSEDDGFRLFALPMPFALKYCFLQLFTGKQD